MNEAMKIKLFIQNQNKQIGLSNKKTDSLIPLKKIEIELNFSLILKNACEGRELFQVSEYWNLSLMSPEMKQNKILFAVIILSKKKSRWRLR